jgi:hypothetical protein
MKCDYPEELLELCILYSFNIAVIIELLAHEGEHLVCTNNVKGRHDLRALLDVTLKEENQLHYLQSNSINFCGKF